MDGGSGGGGGPVWCVCVHGNNNSSNSSSSSSSSMINSTLSSLSLPSSMHQHDDMLPCWLKKHHLSPWWKQSPVTMVET